MIFHNAYKFENIKHAFFNKSFEGATHQYLFKNKNNTSEVLRNRKLVTDFLKCKELIIANQIHSNIAHEYSSHNNAQEIIPKPIFNQANEFQAEAAEFGLLNEHSRDPQKSLASLKMGNGITGDALVTKSKNVALGILTADCAPVFFVDSRNEVIGAAHAGWKGALNGVVDNTLALMLELKAEYKYIKVLIGPCIKQSSYEVGKDFYELFMDSDKSNGIFFVNGLRANHYMFDLTAYITHRLKNLGVKEISCVEHDTYSMSDLYPSYRRAFVNGEVYNKSLLSTIMLM